MHAMRPQRNRKTVMFFSVCYASGNARAALPFYMQAVSAVCGESYEKSVRNCEKK